MGKRTCSFEGCKRVHLARGFCAAHYYRARQNGELEILPPRPHTLLETDGVTGVCSTCGDVEVKITPYKTYECAVKRREADRRKRERARSDPDRAERLRKYHADYSRQRRLSRIGGEGALSSLLEKAGGACEICAAQLTVETLNVDHDHSCCPAGKYCSNCVRGVLCSRCNKGLGQFSDDSTLLWSAISYLSERSIAHRSRSHLAS